MKSTPEEVKYHLRSRLSNAKIVDLNRNFQGENMPELDPEGLDFWMKEVWYSGYSISAMTNRRKAMASCRMTYGLYVPIGTGTNLLDEKLVAIINEFDILDDDKKNITSEHIIGWVEKINVHDDTKVGGWLMRGVSLDMRLQMNDASGLLLYGRVY